MLTKCHLHTVDATKADYSCVHIEVSGYNIIYEL